MCIAALFACPDFALVITDTRRTYFGADGLPVRYSDEGGKLVRTADGWATCTGFGDVAIGGLQRLSGSVAGAPEDVSATLRASLALTDPQPGDKADFFVIGEQGGKIWGAVFDHEGCAAHRGPLPACRYSAVQVPHGVAIVTGGELSRRISEALNKPGASLLDVIRAGARSVIATLPHSHLNTMSEMVEIGALVRTEAGGIATAHLPPAQAKDVAKASDRDLQSLFNPHLPTNGSKLMAGAYFDERSAYGGAGAVWITQGSNECLAMAGQVWQQKAGQDLNLRAYDDGSGFNIIIEWENSIFANGGENITIPEGMEGGMLHDTLYYLYFDGDLNDAFLSTSKDTTLSFNRIPVGSVLTPALGGGQTTGTPIQPI